LAGLWDLNSRPPRTRHDVTSGKTSVTGAGGMGFKSRADQVSHMLPTTCYYYNLDVWALAQSRGDGHRSLETPERVLSEYNEEWICCTYYHNRWFEIKASFNPVCRQG